MNERSVVQLAQDAHAGRLSRRQVLAAGLQLGLATPVIAALMAAAPEASAAPGRPSALGRSPGQEGGDTFTIIVLGGTEDVDPHSTYSTIGSAICYGVYDMLIQYKGESTAEYDPMLAESWEANPENTVFTFKIKPNVFSMTAPSVTPRRLRPPSPGSSNSGWVRPTTCSSGSSIRRSDRGRRRHDGALQLGRPQPLFFAAMACTMAPTWSAQRPSRQTKQTTILGHTSGSWRRRLALVPSGSSRTHKERIVFERFEEYHEGWHGKQFDQIVLRPVPENAIRRQLIEQGDADALTYDLTPEDYDQVGRRSVAGAVLSLDSRRLGDLNAVRSRRHPTAPGFSYAFPYEEVIDRRILGA